MQVDLICAVSLVRKNAYIFLSILFFSVFRFFHCSFNFFFAFVLFIAFFSLLSLGIFRVCFVLSSIFAIFVFFFGMFCFFEFLATFCLLKFSLSLWY